MQNRFASNRRCWYRVAPRAVSAAGLLVLLAGCASNPVSPVDLQPPTGARAPSPYDPGDRVVAQRLDVGRDNIHSGKGPTLESSVTLSAQSERSERTGLGARAVNPGELKRVKYAANGADARDVLRVLIGENLGRDVLIDAAINDKLTMDIDQEMTLGDVSDLVEALAMLHGWSIEDVGDVLAVRKLSEQSATLASAPILQARSAFGGQQTAIRVRPMRYISTKDAETALKGLMSDGAVISMIGRTLVLVDTVNQLDKASRLLAALDVPAFDGAQVYTFRLSDRQPKEAADLLKTLADGAGLSIGGNNAASSTAQFIAVDGTDRIMVLCRDAAAFPAINDLVHQVDRPKSDATRHRYLYHVQHFDPSDLKTLVDSFYAERIDSDAKSGSDKMHLTWEPRQGLLLIQATPEDYADLLTTLRVLDRPPQQVALRTVIAEVALTGALEYGVEYFLQAADVPGLGSLELTGAPGLPAASTGSVFFVGADGLALIQALESEGDVTILTQPYFTALDGFEAKQQVGGETPYVKADQDSTAQSGGNTAIRREIDYRETGVILTIQPQINELGFVRMTVDLEITDVGAQSDLGPEFTTRSLKTEVVVPHGRTLVLGGIIDSESRKTISKVPFLGDAPVIGAAFQRYSDRDTRTELLLTITPTVINDPYQTHLASDPFVQAAAGVRAALGMHHDEMPQGMLYAGEPIAPTHEESMFVGPPVSAPDQTMEEPSTNDAATQDEATPDRVDSAPELPPILRQMMEQSGGSSGGGRSPQ
ncbi:MAG: hypothetical protein KDA20_02395 [Phycisphaerales bacterium]|nr:hypothetical protein [Phycisphaerales bacterium]